MHRRLVPFWLPLHLAIVAGCSLIVNESAQPESNQLQDDQPQNAEPTAAPSSDSAGRATETRNGCDGKRANPAGSGYYVQGLKVYDPDDCLFLARGFTTAMYYSVRPSNIDEPTTVEDQYESIDAIARSGANTVRLLVSTNDFVTMEPDYWNNDVPTHRALVERALKAKLATILTLRTYTCQASSSSAAAWSITTGYWLSNDVIDLLLDHPTLWLEISHRHDIPDQLDWRDSYAGLIKRLRKQGVHNLLVIDAAGDCGQDTATLLRFGSELQKEDPDHNLLFGLSLEDHYKSTETVTMTLNELSGAGLPVHISGFSWNIPMSERIHYDPITFLNRAEELRLGWTFHAWFGPRAHERAVTGPPFDLDIEALPWTEAGLALLRQF